MTSTAYRCPNCGHIFDNGAELFGNDLLCSYRLAWCHVCETHMELYREIEITYRACKVEEE